MSASKDGGPAFGYGNPTHGGDPGMSLRDWLAGLAMQGMAGTGLNPNLPGDPADYKLWPSPEELWRRRAVAAYGQADAMIEARGDA